MYLICLFPKSWTITLKQSNASLQFILTCLGLPKTVYKLLQRGSGTCDLFSRLTSRHTNDCNLFNCAVRLFALDKAVCVWLALPLNPRQILPLPEEDSTMTLLLINTIICVIGILAGVLFAGASLISIANMTVPWRGFLLVAALLIPIMFLVSGVGTWLAYDRVSFSIVISLVALPWLYGGAFVLLMLGSFRA